MSDAWSGPAAIAAALLVVAGAAKVFRPQGLPVPPPLVRAGAVAEAGIGSSALLIGGSLAHLSVAASYLAFAGFVTWSMRRRVPLRSCGCLGETDTPPTRLHVAINLALAAAALGAGITGAPGGLAAAPRLELLPFVMMVIVGTWAAALALRWLPALSVLRNGAHRPGGPVRGNG